MEIMARADALRIVLVGDPKGGAVKAEIAALEKASDELLERMDGMPSLSQQRRPATKVNRRLDL
jgi:cephalosporin-C deacetylase-like acetyl esterase